MLLVWVMCDRVDSGNEYLPLSYIFLAFFLLLICLLFLSQWTDRWARDDLQHWQENEVWVEVLTLVCVCVCVSGSWLPHCLYRVRSTRRTRPRGVQESNGVCMVSDESACWCVTHYTHITLLYYLSTAGNLYMNWESRECRPYQG